jgi:hypothetical protein
MEGRFALSLLPDMKLKAHASPLWLIRNQLALGDVLGKECLKGIRVLRTAGPLTRVCVCVCIARNAFADIATCKKPPRALPLASLAGRSQPCPLKQQHERLPAGLRGPWE